MILHYKKLSFETGKIIVFKRDIRVHDLGHDRIERTPIGRDNILQRNRREPVRKKIFDLGTAAASKSPPLSTAGIDLA